MSLALPILPRSTLAHRRNQERILAYNYRILAKTCFVYNILIGGGIVPFCSRCDLPDWPSPVNLVRRVVEDYS